MKILSLLWLIVTLSACGKSSESVLSKPTAGVTFGRKSLTAVVLKFSVKSESVIAAHKKAFLQLLDGHKTISGVPVLSVQDHATSGGSGFCFQVQNRPEASKLLTAALAMNLTNPKPEAVELDVDCEQFFAGFASP